MKSMFASLIGFKSDLRQNLYVATKRVMSRLWKLECRRFAATPRHKFPFRGFVASQSNDCFLVSGLRSLGRIGCRAGGVWLLCLVIFELLHFCTFND